MVIEAARYRLPAALKISNPKERKDIVAWALRSEGRRYIDNALAIAADLPPVADAGENWDRNPFLLGVGNGVVDLRTGDLRPGHPDDRITMVASVEYDADARCPLWHA